MNIYIGSDHGGFELKSQIVKYLREKYPKTNYNDNPYNINDMGCYENIRCDYPDIAKTVSEQVVSYPRTAFGILVCGTGIGISIAANKVKGVRCALCNNIYSATMAKQHNNANIIALGGRTVGRELAIEIINTFMDTPFFGGRHQERINKISLLEN